MEIVTSFTWIGILGETIYHEKVRKIWPFLLMKQCYGKKRNLLPCSSIYPKRTLMFLQICLNILPKLPELLEPGN